jgi:hypothetical protein
MKQNRNFLYMLSANDMAFQAFLFDHTAPSSVSGEGLMVRIKRPQICL